MRAIDRVARFVQRVEYAYRLLRISSNEARRERIQTDADPQYWRLEVVAFGEAHDFFFVMR